MKRTGPVLTLSAILTLTVLLFSEAIHFEFINLDDPYLVQNNAGLLKPLSLKTLIDPVAGLYHPLTNLTYWVDAQVDGLRPKAFHITNLFFHLLAVCGLFFFVHRLTRSSWAAGVLAAAFAWHPTHVESVVWISERKDVVSVAFFWWALYAHVERRMALVLILAFLSLMAKPFALVLPLLVLGLEFYQGKSASDAYSWVKAHKVYFGSLVGLSGLAAGLAYYSQAAVRTTADADLLSRIFLLPKQILFYCAQSIWPTNLKLIYHSGDLLSNSVGLVLTGFFGLGALAFSLYSKPLRRDLTFGVGFFLITLAPLLKLIPFGDESPVSDRYLYVSQTGLFWTWALLTARSSLMGHLSQIVALGALALWMHGSWLRLPAWENSIAMWQSLLEIDPQSKDAHENLARHYIGLEKPDLALEHLRRGHIEKSDNLQNQAFALLRLGRIREAGEPLQLAEQLTPSDPKFLNLKGNWLMESGDFTAAELYFLKSTAASPKLLSELVRAEALTNLGVLAFRRTDFAKCIEYQNQALSALPAYAYAFHNRALCLLNLKRDEEARADYEMTLKLMPGFAMAHNGLGVLALRAGDLEAAERHFVNAVAADPRLEMAKANLATVRARKSKR